MLLVTIDVISGSLTPAQKQNLISGFTDVAVNVDGEEARELTWVRLNEAKAHLWAIGGKPVQIDRSVTGRLSRSIRDREPIQPDFLALHGRA